MASPARARKRLGIGHAAGGRIAAADHGQLRTGENVLVSRNEQQDRGLCDLAQQARKIRIGEGQDMVAGLGQPGEILLQRRRIRLRKDSVDLPGRAAKKTLELRPRSFEDRLDATQPLEQGGDGVRTESGDTVQGRPAAQRVRIHSPDPGRARLFQGVTTESNTLMGRVALMISP